MPATRSHSTLQGKRPLRFYSWGGEANITHVFGLPTQKLVGWLVGWLIGWLVGWLIG